MGAAHLRFGLPHAYSARQPVAPGRPPMKIHIDIDCTPEEARTFMGLPDLQPMQEAVMKEMQDRMMAAMRSMDPETLIKTWLPAGIANLEQMQKAFWQQFTDSTKKK
jgi:predicted dienelactone hydrolase